MDNFKEMSADHIDGLTRNGQSLREKLTDDKRAKKQGADITFGKRYFDKMREQYRLPDDPEAQPMNNAPMADTVSETLMTAMISAQKPRPDREGMML